MTKRVPQKPKHSFGTTIPPYIRSLMLFQFFIVLVLSGWLYLEYTHNTYLQAYVKSYLQANPTIIQAGIPGVLAAAAGSLYAKLRRTRRELATIENLVLQGAPSTSDLSSLLAQLPQLEVVAPSSARMVSNAHTKRLRRESGRLSRVSASEKIPYRSDRPTED